MPLKQLIIVGAGSFGREVLAWANDIPQSQRDWEVKGFIDNIHEFMNYDYPVHILGKISEYEPHDNEVFICAIADPKYKLTYCEELERKGAEFINLIHPTAVIGPHNNMGKGILMCPYSVISCNITIGNHVTINVHSSIGHDAVLEDGVTLSGHCDVTGFVRLCRGVFLGSGARLLPRACAEEFSVIGAGCVVLTRVKANKTVVGVPARYLN